MSSQDTISMSSQDTVRKGRPPKTKYQANKKNTIHKLRHHKKFNISKHNLISVETNKKLSSHYTRLDPSPTKVQIIYPYNHTSVEIYLFIFHFNRLVF